MDGYNIECYLSAVHIGHTGVNRRALVNARGNPPHFADYRVKDTQPKLQSSSQEGLMNPGANESAVFKPHIRLSSSYFDKKLIPS